MSNYPEIQKVMEQAEKLMDAVDASMASMSRGGIINTSRGWAGFIGNLKKANSLFKKLDKLSKEGGDSYTMEEKQAIEAKALELTKRYKMYYELVDQANKIAKNMVFGKKEGMPEEPSGDGKEDIAAQKQQEKETDAPGTTDTPAANVADNNVSGTGDSGPEAKENSVTT